jgi:hypothetical protein
MLNTRSPWTCAMVHVLLVAPGLLCSVAQAQDAAASQPRLSSSAQYLTCLLANDDLKRDGAQLDADQQRHQQRVAAVQDASADLAAQVRKHAPQNKAEAESYNRAVTRHNADAAKVNTQAQVLRVRQDELNRRIFEYNGRCGTMIVSQDDRLAAEADHRRLRQARAAASSAAD